jgi:hypothetical protein
MTWKLRAQRAAFALVIIGSLAVVSGASWWEDLLSFVYGII